MLHPNLLRKPLSKGVGLPGIPSNRVMPALLLHSKMAQGQILNSHVVQALQIVASTVEVPLTLLRVSSSKTARQGSNQNKNRKQTIQVRQGRINFTTFAELSEGAPVMSGTFSIHSKPAVILFDSGISHSFISAKFGTKVGLDFCHTKGLI